MQYRGTAAEPKAASQAPRKPANRTNTDSKVANSTTSSTSSAHLSHRPPGRRFTSQIAAQSIPPLMGRLNEGTLHRRAGKNDAMGRVAAADSGDDVSAAARQKALQQHHQQKQLSHMVLESSARGGWAAGFHRASELRAAVTTNTDPYTQFEEELLSEINVLRSDPKAYTVYFEQEVTLGFPFVRSEDEYFESDEAADIVSCVEDLPTVQETLRASVCTSIANPNSSRVEMHQKGSRHSKNSAVTNSDNAGVSIAATAESVSRLLSSSTPIPIHAATGNTTTGGAMDELFSPATPLPIGTPAIFSPEEHGVRLTMRNQGSQELTLAQLRVHFARHQRHRTALEQSLKEVVAHWQQSEQRQQEIWAAEDERIAKRDRKRTSGRDRKKSLLAASSEELQQQRRNVAEALNQGYQRRLNILAEELRRSRETCRRTMDGANLILDCIRSLRDARAVPLLRSSRGLTLAARDTGKIFHKDAKQCEAVMQMQNAALLQAEADQRCCQYTSTATTSVPLTSKMPTPALPLAPGGIIQDASGEGESSQQTLEHVTVASQPLQSDDDDAAATAGKPQETGGDQATMFRAKDAGAMIDSAMRAQITETTEQAMMPASPEQLREEVDFLASTAREACSTYGYISGQVRGMQVYGTGGARALVMKMLLGIAIPLFGFTERDYIHPGVVAMTTGALGPARANAGAAAVASADDRHGKGKGSISPASPLSSMKSISNLNSAEMLAFSAHLSSYDSSLFNPMKQLTETAHFRKESKVTTGDHPQDADDKVCRAKMNVTMLTSATCVTGIMVTGNFHPTTPLTALCTGTEERQETTSAGKRAAAAALRLGPLLWRDAHLFGCGWQRVYPEKPIPTYETRERVEREIPRDDGSDDVLVATTVVVARGYEELDMIHQHSTYPMDAVRRLVHGQNGGSDGVALEASQNSSQRLAAGIALGSSYGINKDMRTGSKTTLRRGKAVVDLHPSLDVTLLYPTSHPVQVPPEQGVTCILLRAPAQQVRVLACIVGTNTSDFAMPTSPILDESEVFIQRSDVDIDVVVVLVDLLSAFGRTKGEPFLLHFFERDVSNGGDGAFVPIGFIRVMQVPNRVGGGGSDTHGGGVSGSAVRLVPALRSSTARANASNIVPLNSISSTAKGFLGSLPNDISASLLMESNGSGGGTVAPLELQRLVASLDLTCRLSSLGGPAAAVAGLGVATSPGDYGHCIGREWPAVTLDFHARCATLRSPLIARLKPSREKVRVSITFPNSVDHLQWQVSALQHTLAELLSLEEAETEEEGGSLQQQQQQQQQEAKNDGSMETHSQGADQSSGAASQKEKDVAASEGAAPDGLTTPATDGYLSPTKVLATELPHFGDVDEATGAPLVGAGATRQLPPATTGKKSHREKKTMPAGGAASTGSPTRHPNGGHSVTFAQRCSAGSMLLSRDDIAACVRLPVEMLPDMTGPQSLKSLCEASEQLSDCAAECKQQLTVATSVLSAECARLEKEAVKRKGRDLMRLRQDQDELNQLLADMKHKTDSIARVAQETVEEVQRRIRDQALRRARIAYTQTELRALLERTDRRKPLSVEIWLINGGAAPNASLGTAATTGAVSSAQQLFTATVPTTVDCVHKEMTFEDHKANSLQFLQPAPTPGVSMGTGQLPPAMDGRSISTERGEGSSMATMVGHSIVNSGMTSGRESGDSGGSGAGRGGGGTTLAAREMVRSAAVSSDGNVVVLLPVDADLTVYEAEFAVPERFHGRAVLMVDGHENVSWVV